MCRSPGRHSACLDLSAKALLDRHEMTETIRKKPDWIRMAAKMLARRRGLDFEALDQSARNTLRREIKALVEEEWKRQGLAGRL